MQSDDPRIKPFEDYAAACIATGIPFAKMARIFQFSLVKSALEQNGGNQCRAARHLGIHRNTLHRHLAEAAAVGLEWKKPVRTCGPGQRAIAG